jgi:hypothetical protein
MNKNDKMSKYYNQIYNKVANDVVNKINSGANFNKMKDKAARRFDSLILKKKSAWEEEEEIREKLNLAKAPDIVPNILEQPVKVGGQDREIMPGSIDFTVQYQKEILEKRDENSGISGFKTWPEVQKFYIHIYDKLGTQVDSMFKDKVKAIGKFKAPAGYGKTTVFEFFGHASAQRSLDFPALWISAPKGGNPNNPATWTPEVIREQHIVMIDSQAMYTSAGLRGDTTAPYTEMDRLLKTDKYNGLFTIIADEFYSAISRGDDVSKGIQSHLTNNWKTWAQPVGAGGPRARLFLVYATENDQALEAILNEIGFNDAQMRSRISNITAPKVDLKNSHDKEEMVTMVYKAMTHALINKFDIAEPRYKNTSEKKQIANDIIDKSQYIIDSISSKTEIAVPRVSMQFVLGKAAQNYKERLNILYKSKVSELFKNFGIINSLLINLQEERKNILSNNEQKVNQIQQPVMEEKEENIKDLGDVDISFDESPIKQKVEKPQIAPQQSQQTNNQLAKEKELKTIEERIKNIKIEREQLKEKILKTKNELESKYGKAEKIDLSDFYYFKLSDVDNIDINSIKNELVSSGDELQTKINELKNSINKIVVRGTRRFKELLKNNEVAKLIQSASVKEGSVIDEALFERICGAALQAGRLSDREPWYLDYVLNKQEDQKEIMKLVKLRRELESEYSGEDNYEDTQFEGGGGGTIIDVPVLSQGVKDF